MKSFVPLLTIVAIALTVALLGGPTPQPAPASASVAPPAIETIDFDDLAHRSPVCDCDPSKKCPCAAPCLCNTEPEEALVVGPPPDLISLSNGQVNKLSESTNKDISREIIPSEPPPGLIVPVSQPAAPPVDPRPQPKEVAKPVATGHWETRSYGRRGQFSQLVWVSHVGPSPANAACSNGSCAPPRAAPTYFYNASACAGGCRSCR